MKLSFSLVIVGRSIRS